MPEFPEALNNGIPVSDTSTLTVILQVSSDKPTSLQCVSPRQSQGLSLSCPAKTASEDQAHPLSLDSGDRASNSPGTCMSLTRSNTHGQVGESQILQHGNQTHLDPGHENLLTPGTRVGDFPNVTPWLLPNSQRLLRLFPLLSCQRAHRTGPQNLSILP